MLSVKTISHYYLFLILFAVSQVHAQKKMLDHSVYDAWESISNEQISDNGKYILYNVNVQEGDNRLYLQKENRKHYVDRGNNASFIPKHTMALALIKPLFSETREAKIKKLKKNKFPKDTLAIINFEPWSVDKIPNIKSFSIPKKEARHFAYHLYPVDSIKTNIKEEDKEIDISKLIVFNIKTETSDTIDYVSEYAFSDDGNYLTAVVFPPKKDTLATSGIVFWDLKKNEKTTILPGKTLYKSLTFDKASKLFAFIAIDSIKNDLYLTSTTTINLKKVGSKGMPEKYIISKEAKCEFSDSGSKLFFGIAPYRAPKDTTIVDFEVAKLDIWHYSEPDLQPTQLKNLDKELKRSYRAVVRVNTPDLIIPLGDTLIRSIVMDKQANSEYALGLLDNKWRLETQWEGVQHYDLYSICVQTGERIKLREHHRGSINFSATGKYTLLFDEYSGKWLSYDMESKKKNVLNENLPINFADEEIDRPDLPSAYGVAAWGEDDKYVLVYDRYDIWKFDPSGIKPAENITKIGRSNRIQFRYISLDPDQTYLKQGESILLTAFNDSTKQRGFYTLKLTAKPQLVCRLMDKFTFSKPVKAKDASTILFTKSNFQQSPDLYSTVDLWKTDTKLTSINMQASNYLWGNVELVGRTTEDGKYVEALLYKPENFDSTAKYPVIVYFYEKHTDNLYRYTPPAPSRSIINIPFFVSRGYIVYVPDIYYENGEPGESAMKYVVGGVKDLMKNRWVDADNIAIQGQSWGGYQVAYLVTQTKMFKAAGAGAPVSNMTSAYGGIRWESGRCRQFQYEHQQSRIGKTLWDGLDLYLKNSPLFYADKVETPLLIMHNDNDGAVPWYQGIELFNALRRLGKKTWMLQYNNEEHNLKNRVNSKDLSIRLQQFFDHYLKGEPMPVWMKKGIPATEKGNMGYDFE